jgi:hypothetical protein
MSEKYYTLEEVADDCGYEVDRLLVYGITGELEICLLAHEPWILKEIGLEVKPELIGKIGPYPIPKENILKIRNTPYLRPIGENDRPNIRNILENLIVTHEEKLRFEKEHGPKKEMGTEERKNLLRLIGALIEQHYQGNDYKKGDGSPNANKISEKFHEQLALNDFSDKGMSDKNFRKLIPEAYALIMENKK